MFLNLIAVLFVLPGFLYLLDRIFVKDTVEARQKKKSKKTTKKLQDLPN